MNKNASKIKVLDCTFRDGGYYNQWYFAPKTVARYLSCIATSGVEIMEVGLRLPTQKSFCGPFAYSTDEYLNELPLPSGVEVGVMINAKDFIGANTKALVNAAFKNQKDSPVSLVRIAAHFKELEASAAVVESLAKLGYRIGFNLMQSTGKSPEELAKAARQVEDWKAVACLYFADSFGNMKPQTIKQTVSALRDGWSGDLGIHTHNNMGLALSNSLEAIECGVNWIDSTILGMGRGAGNTATEHLLLELSSAGMTRYNPQSLFPLVLEDFKQLQSTYEWGPSLLYYLSAAYNIHPTYVQELLSSNNRQSQHILDSLEYLRESGAASNYNEKSLARSLFGPSSSSSGNWSAKSLKHHGEVLIVGPGPAASEHQHGLVTFALARNLTVLSTNTTSLLPSALVTAHVACHHTKLFLDFDRYKSLGKPVILPLGMVPDHAKETLANVEVWNYGLALDENVKALQANETSCTIPTNLVAGYAIAIAVASGAKKIFLAGFDGFGPADSQHIAMQNLLNGFKQSYSEIEILSITPTSYDLNQGSVYEPARPHR